MRISAEATINSLPDEAAGVPANEWRGIEKAVTRTDSLTTHWTNAHTANVLEGGIKKSAGEHGQSILFPMAARPASHRILGKGESTMGFNKMSFDLSGKKAIVTGAAKATGLSYAIANGLSMFGAEIAIIDASNQVFETVEAAGGAQNGFHAIQADLTDAKAREDGFHKALELLNGHIDILVNGAGIQYRCPAVDFPAENWYKVIEVNLSATFFLSQLVAAKVMIPNGGGKIINIASMAAFGGGVNVAAYSSSKGGIAQLTKTLSNEWCSKGICVNAIAPGYIETDMNSEIRRNNPEYEKKLTARIPMGRWGVGSDLAGCAVFLASSASDYVTGTVIPVDGGALAF